MSTDRTAENAIPNKDKRPSAVRGLDAIGTSGGSTQKFADVEAIERLEDAERRYHAIFDSAIDSGIIALDLDGLVTNWSRGAERLFGWTEAEMLGQHADRIFTPEDREAGIPASEIENARRDGRASDERWHLRKDGSRFFAHGALTPLSGTRVAGFVKAVRDVTDQHASRAALEEARLRAELMTAASRLGTFDYDLVQGTLTWDDNCRALFGLPPGAPVTYAEAFLQGVHPDDRGPAEAAVDVALDPASGGKVEVEYRTIGIEDGKVRHVAARGQMFFEDGRAVRLLGTVQDVTDARIAEARLRETEQRLRLANRATNDAIWDWDLVSNHVTWNEAVERAYGHRLADVLPTGEWWIGHIHPDDRERIEDSIHAVIDGEGSDWTDEYRFLRADGGHTEVLDRGYVLRDAEGRAIRMIGAMFDQTDRKRIEASLREEATGLAEQVEQSRGELERLWASSPDLLLVIDFNGFFRRVNPAWTTVLGYTADELVGHHVNEFVIGDDHAQTTDAYTLAASGGSPTVVNRYRHKDGSLRWISWAAAPSGELTYATGRDITGEIEAHEALRQTEEALRQAQKVEAVGQLTGGVAHDFNNLLTVIRGSVDLLRRHGLPEDKRARYIDAIADTAERATRLTNQLLAFARRSALQPQVFDAAANLLALETMLRTLGGSRIETTFDLSDAPYWVETDPSQFDTAIVNMAVNARDAMAGEGTLSLRVSRVDTLPPVRGHAAVDKPHVAVSLTDTGTGIAPDQIDQIFEPFFTTKDVGQGTGLGLSQVFGFAKQSLGEVEVRSEVGRGSTFTLYLPEAAAPLINAVGASETEPLPRGACILVVEDNRNVGEFATHALAELGHESYWAQDAEAALAKLKQDAEQFDLVFTDVVMPRRSGIELAEEIARQYPKLPVVLTSGYSHVLAQEGSRGFPLLRKPYSIEELASFLADAVKDKR
ncbi:PAS domain S-box protein [Sphingomonas sp. SAFR-052]|uniref:hybrid sensor histidine kinase/response regulator n=1 Tax=Sphingomonas sp. SAFR-052 TaxID=3436867 RepID=UPI003F7F0C6B